jgi:hypothetical protein
MAGFIKSIDIFRATNPDKRINNISEVFNDLAVGAKAAEYISLMNGTHNITRAAQFASAMNNFIKANFPTLNVSLESGFGKVYSISESH